MRKGLTPSEVLQGAMHGVGRRVQGLARGRTEPHGSPRDPWDVDIESALSQFTLSKALGVWPEMDLTSTDHARGDLVYNGLTIQLRWTKYKHGHLLIHPEDHGRDLFVLATGRDGDYHFPGWILGAQGQSEEFWERVDPNRGPCFCVPQSRLEPLESLL